ncbi:hypothetical protein L249_5931 [Ophiocordyceps polyrhachis-furcata BCC 54312]|uniref:Uncharacterized protein n=1 Tax=Ophiocordyceps polyrhachis-furcata BCC 54312 TaxID=1330021 RepID=A0A367LIQ1_9HYPO|nr:hypothetical protein L249_5931 [Ophiocordyceps polyrhachis-furcata BCC 54312]
MFYNGRVAHPSSSALPPRPRMAPRRFAFPLAAAATSLLAAKLYFGRQASEQRREMAEREAVEQRRRNESLMDVYGDRSSLQALEDAVKFYEKRES